MLGSDFQFKNAITKFISISHSKLGCFWVIDLILRVGVEFTNQIAYLYTGFFD